MYGPTISLAILISALLAEKIVRKEKKDADVLWKSLVIAIVCGVIGARIYHVIDFWELYSKNLLLILQIWKGGLGIFGAIAGGLLGIALYLRYKKEPILEWLDIAGLVMPLGQSVGRLGNYFNQELLPYSIYEALLNLLLFGVLWTLRARNVFRYRGFTFFSYLIGYGIIRFLLEPLHPSGWTIGNIDMAQVISAGLVIIGMIGIKRTVSRSTKAAGS